MCDDGLKKMTAAKAVKIIADWRSGFDTLQIGDALHYATVMLQQFSELRLDWLLLEYKLAKKKHKITPNIGEVCEEFLEFLQAVNDNHPIVHIQQEALHTAVTLLRFIGSLPPLPPMPELPEDYRLNEVKDEQR